jgi:hypothetical protein
MSLKEIEKLRTPMGSVLEITQHDEMPRTFPIVDSILIHPIGITTLPPLPASLVYLNVSGNPLKLPTLPTNLQSLLCENCGLEELPELPKSLVYLDARDNNLKDIHRLPPRLFLLLKGNPLPIGFLNGYGSITKYSKKHIANIYEHEDELVYTMILPKGTILFRNSNKLYNKEETHGVYDTYRKKHILYPEFNVFFYPYPFVADSFVDTPYLHVFELERDVEVLMGVAPSPNTRADRIDSKYMVSCSEIPTLIDVSGHSYDPCFSRSFSKAHPNVSGMFVLAKEDTDHHIRGDIQQRYWSKYRTNFIDNRSAVGVAEIILYPHSDRFVTSPLNYKFVASYNHLMFTYDEGWNKVNEMLTNGTWTIDLFTKMYVNYESASDEVKSRCVPPEEPYKLHYLNYDIWSMQGGKTRRAKREKKAKRVKTRVKSRRKIIK